MGNTLSHVLHQATRLDWGASRDDGQVQNAHRLVERIGPGLHPATVTAHTIDDLVLWLRRSGPTGKGCSNATIRRYLSALMVVLKRAQRMGLIDGLPLFPEPRQLREAEPRELVLQPEWIEALVQELPDERHQALVRFMAAQACRVSEALDLEWARVTLTHCQFVGTKGGRARRLPLFLEAQQALAWGQARGWDRPFPVQYASFYGHHRRAVAAVVKRLGLGPTVQDQWVIHTLRHTRLTQLAQQGWPAPALQQFAGHSSLAVTQRYVHASAVNLDRLMNTTT